MTEYETAALAVQQATLELQTSSLTVEWAQVGMSGLQALVIAGGLWVLYQDGRRRDRKHKENMAALQQQGEALQRRNERSDRQHEENMAALQQQGEALRNVSEGIREMGEGIREMIARTRPA